MANAAARAAVQYEFTVEGTYYSGTKNNKVHRQYAPEKFLLPTTKDAQHTIMRKLLAQRLMTKYPDYVGVRTCQIIHQREVAAAAATRPLAEIPVAEMNMAQLNQFTIEQGLAVDLSKVGSVMDARKKVSDALDDKQILKRQQDEEAAKLQKEKDDKAALGDLSRDPNAPPSDGEGAPGEGAGDVLDQLGAKGAGDDPLKDLE